MDFTNISIDSLIDNSSTNFSTYVKIGEEYINYSQQDHTWSKEELNKLISNNFINLWIHSKDYDKYSYYIDLNSFKTKKSELTPQDRISSIQDVGMAFTKCLFESELTDETIKEADFIANNLVETLLEDLSSVQAIKSLASHDYYTYFHSVRVASYSTAVAIRLGITNPKELHKIALGGILHDIGKKDIDMSIINKEGALTNNEWDIIRQHPEKGHKLLVENQIDNHSLDIILSHHEKLDGSGYPYGLSGTSIHEFVQISTISDIFDALTSTRSYQNKRTKSEAMQFMKEKLVGDKLSPEIFKSLIYCFKENT